MIWPAEIWADNIWSQDIWPKFVSSPAPVATTPSTALNVNDGKRGGYLVPPSTWAEGTDFGHEVYEQVATLVAAKRRRARKRSEEEQWPT